MTSPASLRSLHKRPAPLGHAAGFWLVAGAFLVAMAFSVVPTPLWLLYEERDGFDTFGVTVAFSAYAVGVAASLFLAGHLSDSVGRRTILIPALGLELLAAVLFLVWPGFAGLLVARAVTGLGVGMLTATATAHILDLHAVSRPAAGPNLAELVSTGANLGGFAVGGLVSGLLADFAPVPLLTPYLVFVVLLGAALVGVLLVPETVQRSTVRRTYRPQRIRVPRGSRGVFFGIAALAFAAFSVLGIFTSIAPSFVAGTLGIGSHSVAGLVVFVTFASAALAQVAVRRRPVAGRILLGSVLLVVGLAILAVDVVGGTSLAGFLAGGVVSGSAAGMLFTAALGAGAALAEPRFRGETLAGIFLAAYLGLALPVIGIGLATLSVPLPTAMVGFAALIVTIVVAATALVFVSLPASALATGSSGPSGTAEA